MAGASEEASYHAQSVELTGSVAYAAGGGGLGGEGGLGGFGGGNCGGDGAIASVGRPV